MSACHIERWLFRAASQKPSSAPFGICLQPNWTVVPILSSLGVDRSGQSALFGSFLSRACVRVTVTRPTHVSASAVFCDLASSYYRVVRELLVGHDVTPASLQDICAGLSLTEADLHFVANTIATDPVLAQDSEFLQRTVQEVGHFSCF